MNLFTELKGYLEANHSAIKLCQPLYFSGLPALRFDLQHQNLDTSNDDYFHEVVQRMDRIHSEVMSDNDEVILLYQKYTYKRRKIRLTNYLFKQLNLSTVKLQFKRNSKPFNDIHSASPSDGSCQVIIKDIVRNINFHSLYLATSHMDFNRKPLLTARDGELYIVNLSRNTIMLMYDDRGCDLVSNDVDLLRSYYHKLSDLVIEANRPQIVERLGILA